MSGLTSEQLKFLEEGTPSMAERKIPVGKNGNTVLPVNTPMDFAGNSEMSKRAPKKKLEAVTQGRVQERKKSPGKRISETLLADSASDVFSGVVVHVLIPAAKSLISDIGKAIIDGLLYGRESTVISRRSRIGGPVVSYNQYYKEPRDTRYFRENTHPTDLGVRSIRRARQNFDDIILNSREDGEQVLSILLEMIDSYGIATLADFYELVGIETSHVDYKYGWESLNRAGVVRMGDGFILNLPRPIPL